MLSEATLEFLSTLTYRADAERRVCWMPLSGIYWADEMPDIPHLMDLPEDDRKQIFRLFAIRMQLCKGKPLSEVQRELWDTTRSQAPSWALFHRLQISADDQLAQKYAEQESVDVFQDMLTAFKMGDDEADEASASENDDSRIGTATFLLTQEQTGQEKKPWWKRLFEK